MKHCWKSSMCVEKKKLAVRENFIVTFMMSYNPSKQLGNIYIAHSRMLVSI